MTAGINKVEKHKRSNIMQRKKDRCWIKKYLERRTKQFGFFVFLFGESVIKSD